MQKPNYPRKFRSSLSWHLLSSWEAYLSTFALTCAAVSASVYHKTTPQSNSDWFPITIGVCVFAFCVSAWNAIRKDAYRRTFNPDLALRYTDIFYKEIEEERKAGTRVLISYHEVGKTEWKDITDAPQIEPILDVLDDLGFLLQGHQISEWVVWQYFSFWIQLYYEASREYIAWKRAKDPTLWEHLPNLYSDMMKIYAHKTGRSELDLVLGKELLRMLKDELDMQPSAYAKPGTKRKGAKS